MPYFGRFPSYFPLYLKSCAANHTITWLLITDQTLKEIIIPDNFIVKNSTFYDIQNKAEGLFGKAPDTPYALCKYRVVYHELFKENISGFDFWGFCDCDLIFGNLRYFITDEVLDKYDKISWRGHLTLFKNTLINCTILITTSSNITDKTTTTHRPQPQQQRFTVAHFQVLKS